LRKSVKASATFWEFMWKPAPDTTTPLRWLWKQLPTGLATPGTRRRPGGLRGTLEQRNDDFTIVDYLKSL
jgi:hypothetical protein